MAICCSLGVSHRGLSPGRAVGHRGREEQSPMNKALKLTLIALASTVFAVAVAWAGIHHQTPSWLGAFVVAFWICFFLFFAYRARRSRPRPDLAPVALSVSDRDKTARYFRTRGTIALVGGGSGLLLALIARDQRLIILAAAAGAVCYGSICLLLGKRMERGNS